MVLPTSTLTPDSPAVALGVAVSELSDPQAGRVRAAAAAPTARTSWVWGKRVSTGSASAFFLRLGQAGTRLIWLTIASSRPRSTIIGSPFLKNTVWSQPYT